MSNRSASAVADIVASALCVLDALAGLLVVSCAAARLVNSARAKSVTRIRAIRLLRFIMSPYSLVFLRFFITRGFRIRLGHEFSSLRFPVLAATLVVHAAVGIHPYHAAGLGGRNFRAGSRAAPD